MRRVLALCLLLPLAACDETAGLHAGIDLTVDDAVEARQQGDYEQAVRLLNDALAAEPRNAEVRVELATTLLQRDKIDLLDLDRIGQFLSTATGTGAAPAAPRGGCALAQDPTAQAFDPTDVDGFDEIIDALETIVEAGELLDPVIPAALQGFDVCTSVVGRSFAYDRDGALAELSAQGLSEAQVAQALAVNALAQFLGAYVFVVEELPQQATWYRLADGSVAICVDDEDAFRAQTESAIEDLGEAVLSLDARASLLGTESVAAEVVEIALDAYEEIRDAVADYCAG